METGREIVLHGAGEHARVVLDALFTNGDRVLALFDPKYDGQLMGVAQQGAYQATVFPNALAIVPIGDNKVRKYAVSLMRHRFTNIQHKSSIVSPFAQMGVGNMIMHSATVQAFAKIGNHVIVNTRSCVDHDCVLDDFVHIAPGAVLCGRVSVGEGALIGAGAIVLPGIQVGAWAVVGAGSVVTKSVLCQTIVAGNPAKVIGKVNEGS